MVEPSASLHKEKAFSIAAALPMPCYGSLVDDLSNACLHSEERLPFSQTETSPQHIAQQLTLLQQVNTSSVDLVHHFTLVLLLLFALLTTRGRHVSNNAKTGPEYSAYDLTSVMQEIFQGCHPVHFLNSRVQGVRDKLSTPNK